MNDREHEKAEIVRLVEQGARPKRRPKSEGRNVTVRGDRNVVAGGDVNINKREVIRTTVQPGPGHITPGQAAQLQELVHKAVDQDVASGMTRQQAFAKWWSVVKRRYSVPTYHQIPRELGDEAITWLRQQIAIKHPTPRRVAIQKGRTDFYKAIWARSKESGYSKGEVYGIVYNEMGKRVSSLKQLSYGNLERLYYIIMSLDDD